MDETNVNSCCNKNEQENESTQNKEGSCCSVPKETADQPSHFQKFTIQGMDCPSCAETLEKGLSKIQGVGDIQVSYASAKLSLKKDSSVHTNKITEEVKKLGFSAFPVLSNTMQTYKIEGMDCSSCAQTLENHLNKNPDVQEVRVNFSTGKMKIDHRTTVEKIKKEVKRSGFTAHLDEKLQEDANTSKFKKEVNTIFSGLLLAIGFALSFTPVPEWISIAAYAGAILTGGFKPARSAFYAIKSKSLDMNVLMASAAIGAALIGEWFEGAMVVWLFALGNTLQDRSLERTRESIRSLVNLTPSEATVKRGDQWVQMPVENISIESTVLIKAGDKIPVDGTVMKGFSSVNQAPITGESIPVDKHTDDPVYAGTINESGSLEVTVTKKAEDTTIAKIIHLVEEAQEKKAPTQAFIDRFANVYTPIVFGLALSIMILPPLLGFGSWGDWFYKGLALLVVACPCALVISTPVAIVSAIGNAARNGVLIKGGTFLEKAGTITAIAFDKTGTLTEGKPKVSHVIPVETDPTELLRIVRTLEDHSNHPIARAIIEYTNERNISSVEADDFATIAGKGVQATIEGEGYFAGKPGLFRDHKVNLSHVAEHIESLEKQGETLILVGTRNRLMGIISVADSIRAITVNAIQTLKGIGINESVMLTGDHEGTAEKIAGEAGIDRYFAGLLPEDKVTSVKTLQKEGKQVAMVGDGINDAPALATSDLGIAMGGAGTDTAMETADIVLMADNLEKLPYTVRLSRKALAIIKQNIWFSILTKVAALVLIFPGLLTLWMAVLADTGAALIVILNSMRLIRQK
ncbi:cadmium-translocating P-type ATPase [Halobacillus yeomjeoni]|uniref:heavy metal translocating P-type ATPase n=1 Tax=Halobacillus yeomjeoni TaxID=311194 RepID=UPI001CD27485|nr:heavy metal translocating P-type ATPase [Halobacillus yeomjeoni]MCA0983131.1 cadmium-translocating P-type ATPase [Halobacillus yeomjeoni]